ncbi:DUF6185 family protein [Streptomyces sp. NPDC003753]
MTDQLNARIAEARIRFEQHGRTYVQVQSNMKILVPEGGWPRAKNLLLSESSPKYRTAMRCLLRRQEEKLGKKNLHHDEWRLHGPQVTTDGKWVTVQYDALTWVKKPGPVWLGPWMINVEKKGKWNVSLQPPSTLQQARWEHVEVDLGGLRTAYISQQASSTSEKSLVWRDKPPSDVTVDVEPPWQRTLALHSEQSFWSTVGIASWWVCASAVIALAAFRLPWRSPSPESGSAERGAHGSAWQVSEPNSKGSESLAKALVQWAGLSVAVALMVVLLIAHPVISVAPPWRTVISIAAGLTLVLVARPWFRAVAPPRPKAGAGETAPSKASTDKSADPGDVRRRQARAVIAMASAVAVAGWLVVLAPHLFGLEKHLKPEAPLNISHKFGLALMGMATLWLWLAAMTAWAWRFAQEGRLVPRSWTAKWNDTPVRWIAAVGALLAAVAGVMLAFFWWAWERQWKRVTWLLDPTDSDHDRNVSTFLLDFPFTGLTWLYAYAWVLTGIALVAALSYLVERQRALDDSEQEQMPLWPVNSQYFLTAAVFAFVVGLRNVTFAGSTALYGIWLPLNMLSLYVVLAVGRRWSVLGLRRPGASQKTEVPCIQRLATKGSRHELLTKAHQYRNLHHQLYLVDHGRKEGVTREKIEDQLQKLHEWLVAGCGENYPRHQDSVLDVALAWGPEDHWWDNGWHGARLAFFFGMPASAALVWLTYMKDPLNWILTLHDPTGIPQMVANFATYELAWAGAGFVLGALWRLLPGRRAPVRALGLTAAYAIPFCVGALLSRITDTDLGYTFLTVLLMLTVLTLTSIWMDTETFSEERQLWPTRFGLLLSIYQLRGLSAQIAYILAQVSAAVGLWLQLAGGKFLPGR